MISRVRSPVNQRRSLGLRIDVPHMPGRSLGLGFGGRTGRLGCGRRAVRYAPEIPLRDQVADR